MKIRGSSRAGSVESGDILVMLHPNTEGIEVQLESRVYAQYGKHIERIIKETLLDLGAEAILVIAEDSGALDYTIKSRVRTAFQRAQEMSMKEVSVV